MLPAARSCRSSAARVSRGGDMPASPRTSTARACSTPPRIWACPFELCDLVDSVWSALCKGLGAPVGAVLAGDRASCKACRAAKMLGGGMRQAGLIAAPAIVGLRDPYPSTRATMLFASAGASAGGCRFLVRRLPHAGPISSTASSSVSRATPARSRAGCRVTGCWPTAKSEIRFVTHSQVDEAMSMRRPRVRRRPRVFRRRCTQAIRRQSPRFPSSATDLLSRRRVAPHQAAAGAARPRALRVRCLPLLQGRGGSLRHRLLRQRFPALHGARVLRRGAQGRPPVVGYISGSDDLRIRIRSDIEDARKLPPVALGTTIGNILTITAWALPPRHD